jgi:hypothetical protein
MTDSEQNELNQAVEYISYWKPQLRLDHIDFELYVKSPGEYITKLADCLVAPSRHRQKIGLRNPKDRSERDRDIFRHDLEVAVVHELLHTKEMLWRDHPKVDEVFKDKWLEELHEDSLDAVAEALVRARRGITR